MNKKNIKEAIKNIIWMARRYADGRQTYAVNMFNESYDILKKELGDIDLIKHDKTLTEQGKYFPYAYDGGGDLYNQDIYKKLKK